MAELKLIYLDTRDGRGEAARLALSLGGIPFEDDRVAFADWPGRRAGTPFGAVPVLEASGGRLAQSNAINRYVGRLTGLYPSDPWQAALCDEAMDAVEDVLLLLVPTFRLPEDEKRRQREALVLGPIPVLLGGLERRLAATGGYFADGRLTVADLKVFGLTRFMRSGAIDHMPQDLVDRLAPSLAAHCDAIAEHPGVVAYYDRVGGQAPDAK